jgi:tetratricopeptide (TPR) repeat protein
MGATRQDGYSVRDVADLLGLSVAEVRRCVRAGLLTARQTPSGEVRLTFQDLVLLRKAAGLISSRVPPHRVRRALVQLKRQLSDERPLSAVQLVADGPQLLARDNGALWNPVSRQLVFDFSTAPAPAPSSEQDREAPPPRAAVVPLRLAPKPQAPVLSADQWYEFGCQLEDEDGDAAAEAYRCALEKDPDHVASRINLGRLLHADGELEQAEVHFRRALSCDGPSATAAFNLGVTLEDQGKLPDAVTAYERAIAIEARCEDAHFNLARLHERMGNRPAALRALKAYRALTGANRR